MCRINREINNLIRTTHFLNHGLFANGHDLFATSTSHSRAKYVRITVSDPQKVQDVSNGKLPMVRTTDVPSRMLDGAVKLPWQLFGRESLQGSALDVNEVALPAKGGRDLLRIFKELKQSVTNNWGAVKPPVVEEDKEFLERKGKLHDFENQIATAAVKANRLYRELNAQTVKHLDKLHDYLGVMLAINNAFSDRANALLTVQTLLSELASLNVRIENLEAASSKIFCGDRSRIRKIDELKETVRVKEEAKTCAVREYERIKGQPDSYHELIGNLHHTERLAPDEVAMLVTSLKALSGAVSYIDSDHHKMLLSSISGMSLWNYGPDVMDAAVSGKYLHLCLDMLEIADLVPLAPLRLEKVIKERMSYRSSKQPWIAKAPFSFLASTSP
ncbi:hypothetical protein AgCh_014872 [Apium graveolens]